MHISKDWHSDYLFSWATSVNGCRNALPYGWRMAGRRYFRRALSSQKEWRGSVCIGVEPVLMALNLTYLHNEISNSFKSHLVSNKHSLSFYTAFNLAKYKKSQRFIN